MTDLAGPGMMHAVSGTSGWEAGAFMGGDSRATTSGTIDFGPLPPRSAWGLRCQFFLQWIYLPLGFGMALVAALLGGGGGSPLFGGSPKGVPKDPYGDSLWLSPRQYRLELNGTPEQWRERAGFALRRAIAQNAQDPDETISLPVSAYRGVGLEGLDELAGELGWRLDRGWLRFEAVVLKPVSASP
ncbi:hypothetical protein ACFVU3_14455 [Streptomyces sp. NPDC058052]|uniref:hypothetical protein n=1 Tax=Streptomyces sp. NPDC058052 TaxID=3346316 RepID=UPI0036EE67ED